MRGTNTWNGCGKVAGNVKYGKTKNDGDACNFKVHIVQPHKPHLYIRINVYGNNVAICRDRNLDKGNFVVISGELMNREISGREEGDSTLTEVRCSEIVIQDCDNVNDSGNGGNYGTQEE